MKGTVWRIGGDVSEEGFLLIDSVVDEPRRRLEVEVRAIAAGFDLLVVVEKDGIGVAPLVLDRLRRLAESAAAMHVGFLKSLITGPQRVVVAEMPFAENSGRVSRVRKGFGDGILGSMHHGATFEGIDHACAVVVASGHQIGTGRGANGTHIEIAQGRAFAGKLIEMGRVDQFVSVDAKITVTLVIGHDENDVGGRRAEGEW